jgi:hypothetical protein
VVNPIMLAPPFHAEQGSDYAGQWSNHDRSMWLLTHEVAHRWRMLLEYMEDGVKKPLWDAGSHWRAELNNPSAFPIRSELETSPMGGYRWRANEDGTYSAIYQGLLFPSGYSWLDLYALGMAKAEEIPDLQLLEAVEWIGARDGYQLARGKMKRITMDQTIAALGPRTAPAGLDPFRFNTAFILLAEPEGELSVELMERLERIRTTWLEHFPKATGGRGYMTADVELKKTNQ